jgi:hypothetical protein
MPCEVRDKLLDLLLAALKTHSDATQAMIGREGEAWKQASQLAAKAEANYQDCRKALIAHLRSHGCTR